jgi:hypothetical protein
VGGSIDFSGELLMVLKILDGQHAGNFMIILSRDGDRPIVVPDFFMRKIGRQEGMS